MWRVYEVRWLQDAKPSFATFFLWRSYEAFITTCFSILLKKAFWWRVACHVPSIGPKYDLGPAEHTMAARGLVDFTVHRGIHFFCHDSCGRVIGFCGKTPFLSGVLGAADLTVLLGILLWKLNENSFMKHPTCSETGKDPHTGTRRGAAKKMRICVWCIDVITFCGPQAASHPNYPRDAVPGTWPVSAHVKDIPGLGKPNSLKSLLWLRLSSS